MKSRRTRYFIDAKVQSALIKKIMYHWFLFMVVLFLTLPLWRLTHVVNINKPFTGMVLEGWRETAPIFVIFLAVFPLLIWDTIKLSHRFVGPIYRLRLTLRKLADGEIVEPIQLRDDDFWRDVTDDFNAVIDTLNAKQLPPASSAITNGARYAEVCGNIRREL